MQQQQLTEERILKVFEENNVVPDGFLTKKDIEALMDQLVSGEGDECLEREEVRSGDIGADSGELPEIGGVQAVHRDGPGIDVRAGGEHPADEDRPDGAAAAVLREGGGGVSAEEGGRVAELRGEPVRAGDGLGVRGADPAAGQDQRGADQGERQELQQPLRLPQAGRGRQDRAPLLLRAALLPAADLQEQAGPLQRGREPLQVDRRDLHLVSHPSLTASLIETGNEEILIELGVVDNDNKQNNLFVGRCLIKLPEYFNQVPKEKSLKIYDDKNNLMPGELFCLCHYIHNRVTFQSPTPSPNTTMKPPARSSTKSKLSKEKKMNSSINSIPFKLPSEARRRRSNSSFY